MQEHLQQRLAQRGQRQKQHKTRHLLPAMPSPTTQVPIGEERETRTHTTLNGAGNPLTLSADQRMTTPLARVLAAFGFVA